MLFLNKQLQDGYLQLLFTVIKRLVILYKVLSRHFQQDPWQLLQLCSQEYLCHNSVELQHKRILIHSPTTTALTLQRIMMQQQGRRYFAISLHALSTYICIFSFYLYMYSVLYILMIYTCLYMLYMYFHGYIVIYYCIQLYVYSLLF